MIERMVRVEWLDATYSVDDVPDSWVKQVTEAGGAPTVSVGLLAKSNRRCVVLVQTLFFDGCSRQALCIPRGMIKKLTYLEPHEENEPRRQATAEDETHMRVLSFDSTGGVP